MPRIDPRSLRPPGPEVEMSPAVERRVAGWAPGHGDEERPGHERESRAPYNAADEPGAI